MSNTTWAALRAAIRAHSIAFILAAHAALAAAQSVEPPLALPGPHAVACSDVAQDFARAGSNSAQTYWEATRSLYVTSLLSEPDATLALSVPTPGDGELFGSFAGGAVPYAVLVCYPTSPDNPRPDYALPTGRSVPHMQRTGDAPLLESATARYPVLLYSHGYGGSPLSSEYLDSVLAFASYGYVVAAPFHGDARFSDLLPSDASGVLWLLRHLDDFIAMQALRPLALSATLDRLLADPAWSAHVDPARVGGFGISQGGESLLLMRGAGLTRSLGLSWSSVQNDARLKGAVGYIPYFGQSLWPSFGRDQQGLDGVALPYLAIGGTADRTAPLDQTRQGIERLAGPRALVAVDALDHHFDPADATDIYTWSVTFLDAHVRGDVAAQARLARMTSVAGGGVDQVVVAYNGTPARNFGGLWWNDPAGSESGWGLNLAHQADILFATWYTYDATGRPWWLSLTALRTGDATYAGALYQTRGPAYDAVPFSPSAVVATPVGTATLSFTDADHGRFAYAVNGVQGSKAITREVFGPLPECSFGTTDLASATNFQDLWWNAPAGSESGWGLNITHQGDTLFAAWFTYDLDGAPLWLTATAPKAADKVYTGMLYRTRGPAFDAAPFDPARVTVEPVGTATLAFADGNRGTFTFDIGGTVQSKPITRQVFAAPGTSCR